MNFYEQLKPEADRQVGKAASRVLTLRKQLQKIEHRLQLEKDNAGKAETQIEKLKILAPEALSGDDSSYEKYKVATDKRGTELRRSRSAISDFETIVIPKAKNDLIEAKMDLGIELSKWAVSSKPVASEKITELLTTIDDCLAESVKIRRDFLSSLEEVYKDYGMDFSLQDQKFYPGPWFGDETSSAGKSILLLVEHLAKQRRLSLSAPAKPPAPELVSTVKTAEPKPAEEATEKPAEKPEPFLQFRRECSNATCGADFTTADENVKLCPACDAAEKLLQQAEPAATPRTEPVIRQPVVTPGIPPLGEPPAGEPVTEPFVDGQADD